MKYKAIIYDIDGTLLNTFDMNFYPLLEIIKEELHITKSIDEVKKYAAYPGLKTLKELKISEDVYPRWVQYVNEYPGGAKEYEGIQEVLSSVNIKQGIASSKRKMQYDKDIISRGLDQYIDAVVLEDDCTKHKPDPEPLLLCMKKLSVKPEETIYIGDMYSDYLASCNAGCDFGYALYGNIDQEDIPGAKYIFHKPEEILSILKES